MEADEINRIAAPLNCCAAYCRVLLIPIASAAHWLMQIRHNLVVPEKPFFRRGRCVLKTAHHVVEAKTSGIFGMKWTRIGLASAAMAVCALACAWLWPHARDAVAMLAAQDDPAEISNIQLNSALRNSQTI